MSQHKSFTKGASAAQKKRNVLKRFERTDLLKKRKILSEDSVQVLGLPKTLPEQ